MDPDNKMLNAGILIFITIIVAKLISALIIPRSTKCLPLFIGGWPVVGGLLRFLRGSIFMIREKYPKLGSIFTVNLAHWKMTFLIGHEVLAHFFKASEVELSQQEVYRFNVPTFGPGVVFDVDYSIQQEQFLFFTEALRVTKLKGYVDQMVMEAEDYFLKWGDCGEVNLRYELEHLIILSASRCLLGRKVHDKLFNDGTKVKNLQVQKTPTKKPKLQAKVPFEKGHGQMDLLKLTRTHPDLAGSLLPCS